MTSIPTPSLADLKELSYCKTYCFFSVKMFKITAIVSLLLIGSTLWAASLSCDSCGSECASACGTRHFRSCCFNYLRKKRGPETLKFLAPNQENLKETQPRSKLPMFVVENIPVPEQWISNLLSNENHPFSIDDMVENRMYDA
uniref:Trissin 1 splicing variant A n=1 Tax=Spodoptera exigua TaxID=7107 RepID=A0A385H903_SPOEX|nr:trissin 1 splicing variant A [Spodoptera exigua]